MKCGVLRMPCYWVTKNRTAMLFRKWYGYGPDGLLELANDLASADPKPRRQALTALRKDRHLRQGVHLVVLAFEIADEQQAAGTFQGDVVQLEILRPIAGIVARLHDLRSMSDARSRDAASAVLKLLEETRSATAARRPAPQN